MNQSLNHTICSARRWSKRAKPFVAASLACASFAATNVTLAQSWDAAASTDASTDAVAPTNLADASATPAASASDATVAVSVDTTTSVLPPAIEPVRVEAQTQARPAPWPNTGGDWPPRYNANSARMPLGFAFTPRLWANVGVTTAANGIAATLIVLPFVLARGAPMSTGEYVMLGSGIVLAVFAAPVGVTLVGNAMGGRGSFWITLLGHLLSPIVPIVGQLAGPALAYEWHHNRVLASEQRGWPAPATTVSLVPTHNGAALLGSF
ncbi:MAG: hypothetical protein JNK05_33115 [Myxococcales bacterium]|nr:hypothetical protein [Myxococcales bacterium]